MRRQPPYRSAAQLLRAALWLTLASAAAQDSPPPPPSAPPGYAGMFGVVRQSLKLWEVWDFVIFFLIAGLPVYLCCLWMTWCLLCCWCRRRREQREEHSAERKTRRRRNEQDEEAALATRKTTRAEGKSKRRADAQPQHGTQPRYAAVNTAPGQGDSNRQPPTPQTRAPTPKRGAGGKPLSPNSSTGLPAGWEAFIDDNSGDPYWYNQATGATTWEHPGAFNTLPTGWEMLTDDASGEHYWYNQATGATTWQRPTA